MAVQRRVRGPRLDLPLWWGESGYGLESKTKSGGMPENLKGWPPVLRDAASCDHGGGGDQPTHSGIQGH